MMAAAPELANLWLSLAAVGGLVALDRAVAAQGGAGPLIWRFRLGIAVTLVLYAARAARDATGVTLFWVVELLAAVLVPLAVLILAEGLTRRHAPPPAKVLVLGGTAVFLALAPMPAGLVDPLRMHALMAYQLSVFSVAGWLVFGPARAGLTAAEQTAAGRLGLSLILMLPLVAGDFLGEGIGLPIQPSALAVLVLCRLALSLATAERTGAALVQLALTFALGLGSGALIALMAGGGALMATAVMLTTLLLADVIRAALPLWPGRHGESLVPLLSEGAEGLTSRLLAHPVAAGGALLEPGDLRDLDVAVLARRLSGEGVLVRAAPPADLDGAETELLAELWCRTGASHLVALGPRILALAVPGLAAGGRLTDELRLAARLAQGGRDAGG